MKIGIISMQRVPNYGSFLQAMGLKQILESLGHDVVFIDYRPGRPAVPYPKISGLIYRIRSIPLVAWSSDWIRYNVQGQKKFVYAYRLKYLKQLGISYKHKYNVSVDVAVIGSDEVFNCLQKGPNVGFSPMLFGEGVLARKKISYAASFGYAGVEGLEKYKVAETIKNYLDNFADLSVRDQHSYETIYALCEKKPEINLDPVLIADYELRDIEIREQNYIVLYTYKSRKYPIEDQIAIIEFCRKHHKKLISIGNSQPWVEHKIMADPLKMLAYICNADFVITDTFHGTVFSIKYNKSFATLIRPDNYNKLDDLLTRLKQKDRSITKFCELDEVYSRRIDYTKTNIIIEEEKKHTRQYLQNAIKVN